MKVETIIDKVAAFLLFLVFPLWMTGGMVGINQTAETSAAVVEAATLCIFVGFGCLVGGFLIVGLHFVVPRSIMRKELTRPTVSIEWN